MMKQLMFSEISLSLSLTDSSHQHQLFASLHLTNKIQTAGSHQHPKPSVPPCVKLVKQSQQQTLAVFSHSPIIPMEMAFRKATNDHHVIRELACPRHVLAPLLLD